MALARDYDILQQIRISHQCVDLFRSTVVTGVFPVHVHDSRTGGGPGKLGTLLESATVMWQRASGHGYQRWLRPQDKRCTINMGGHIVAPWFPYSYFEDVLQGEMLLVDMDCQMLRPP
jgi:hypothetical protein